MFVVSISIPVMLITGIDGRSFLWRLCAYISAVRPLMYKTPVHTIAPAQQRERKGGKLAT